MQANNSSEIVDEYIEQAAADLTFVMGAEAVESVTKASPNQKEWLELYSILPEKIEYLSINIPSMPDVDH